MSTRNYGLVSAVDELATFFERLAASDGPIGFDIETGYLGEDKEKYSLHPETAIVVGFSFTNSVDWARYVPLRHDTGENLDNQAVARLLWPLLQTGRAVIHNAPFELRHLSRWFREHLGNDANFGGTEGFNRGYFPYRSCTQVESYLAAEYQSFGLKYLVKEIFDHTMIELHELFPDLAKNRRAMLRFNVLDPHDPKVIEYACEDALWALAVHRHYYDKVRERLLYKVEMGVLDCVCEMEDYGVQYDWGLMRRTAEELRVFRDRFNAEIMARLSELVGGPVAINLASPKQVGEMLYGQLGMKTSVYTAASKDKPASERRMSTGAIALAGLAKRHPVVKMILQWKEMTRLLGTYLEKYESAYSYAADGRTHPNHLSAVVVTGRFAVADPPYQQCGLGEYEALTPFGWERLDKLADGVPVAQYHDDGAISFVVPEVVRSEYHGEMIELDSSEGGRWVWTPNHRMVYRQRRARGDRALTDVRACTAEEWEARLLAQRMGAQGRRLHDRRFPKAGYRMGGRGLTDQQRHQLRVAIACQADGHLTSSGYYRVQVYIDRKVAALHSFGLPVTQYPPRHSTVNGREYRDRVPFGVDVPAWTVAEWLDGTPERNFRPEAILSLHVADLRWFVDEVMQWDGDATRGNTYGQKTTRRLSVDTVQAAAALCGFTTSLYERPAFDAVTVNVWDRTHKEAGWQTVRRVPAPGMVYCVTVPTGMFLCRNEQGKVIVTGNSPKKYHYDVAEAEQRHVDHAKVHGPKCTCDDPQFQPEPGTCFQFNFRNAIVAPPDHYILGFDLSQVELRAIAGEAQETSLLRAFEAGQDVHTLTASLMLRVPVEQITSDQRQVGKTMNFALLYGMSPQGLADRLGISLEEAEALYDKYFSAFSSIAVWNERQVAQAKSSGRVMSRFGRVLPIWEYQSDKAWIRSKGDRAAVNYPIQGGATGDYVKIAMVRSRQRLRAAGLADRVHLVMNVHDALEYYVHKSVQPQDVIAVLQPAVVYDVPGWPPMAAEWHVARKWGTPVEVELKPDGTFLIKTEREIEIRPSVEVDEDTGEEVPVLPDVDPATLAAALRSETPSVVSGAGDETPQPERVMPGPAADGRQVIVTVTDMPDEDSYKRFLEFILKTPGPNKITLSTPEGDLDLDVGTSISPAESAAVAMCLAGATVTYNAADVDAADVVAGLVL